MMSIFSEEGGSQQAKQLTSDAARWSRAPAAVAVSDRRGASVVLIALALSPAASPAVARSAEGGPRWDFPSLSRAP